MPNVLSELILQSSLTTGTAISWTHSVWSWWFKTWWYSDPRCSKIYLTLLWCWNIKCLLSSKQSAFLHDTMLIFKSVSLERQRTCGSTPAASLVAFSIHSAAFPMNFWQNFQTLGTHLFHLMIQVLPFSEFYQFLGCRFLGQHCGISLILFISLFTVTFSWTLCFTDPYIFKAGGLLC